MILWVPFKVQKKGEKWFQGMCCKRVWGKAKMRPEFALFQEALENQSVTIEQLETLFTPAERTDVFFNWKKNGEIIIK